VKAFSSDQKVYIAAYDKVVYPDIVVVCGSLVSPPFDEHALSNPVLVVESSRTPPRTMIAVKSASHTKRSQR
jgi:hypothetical protein